MTDKEKELLLKDLCARLPYGVILLAPNGRTICQTDGNTGAELFVEEGWKPYLRPMSSMTEEERKEYNDIVKNIIDFYDCPKSKEICFFIILIDWLNTHHFDYRGLIERGLALEAPKEMYK